MRQATTGFPTAARKKRERRLRLRLLRRARAGDAGALCILWEKYHLRLPLVERQLPYTFPWMRRGARRQRAEAAGDVGVGSRPAVVLCSMAAGSGKRAWRTAPQ